MDRRNREIKNICVYGVGGVGGYFGGKLARAIETGKLPGRHVFFIARGRHLQEIRLNGLMLNTSEQDGIVCRPTLATDSTAEIPPPDLCLICIKSYDLNEALKGLAGKIRENTVLIPLLNGVDIEERMRRALGKGIILPACCYIGTHVERPGVVTQRGPEGLIVAGPGTDLPWFAPDPVLELFHHAGIRFEWRDNPYKAIWEKYIFVAPYALVTAGSGKTLGAVYADESLRDKVRGVTAEIAAIAGKKGIDLPPDVIQASLERVTRFPPESKTSYQRDIEAGDTRNEGDLFAATIISLGESTGVPTPVTRSLLRHIEEVLETTGKGP